MKVRITRRVTKVCPYDNEIDEGWLTMEFEDSAPELHRLAEIIASLGPNPSTHEQFTQHVADAFRPASVTTYWRTAGWDVEVEA